MGLGGFVIGSLIPYAHEENHVPTFWLLLYIVAQCLFVITRDNSTRSTHTLSTLKAFKIKLGLGFRVSMFSLSLWVLQVWSKGAPRVSCKTAVSETTCT